LRRQPGEGQQERQQIAVRGWPGSRGHYLQNLPIQPEACRVDEAAAAGSPHINFPHREARKGGYVSSEPQRQAQAAGEVVAGPAWKHQQCLLQQVQAADHLIHGSVAADGHHQRELFP